MCSVRAAVLLLGLLVCLGAAADTLYKYRGADGEWIYTDRKPPGQVEPEVRELRASFVPPEFTISHETFGTGIEFVAHNEFHVPVEVRLEFVDIRGVEYPHPDNRLRWLVEPRSDLLLLTLEVLETVDAPYAEYLYEFMPGDPTARHDESVSYRAPFSRGRSFPITQAYPDTVSHRTPDSLYAVDIAMPEGTNVLAARDGTVFNVASTHFKNGQDLTADGPAANVVRILHDDGTFAVYAHLNWNSIRVKPGERVRTGQYIADSGNTGFSTGPHLHFAVQKNTGLKIESLPFVFLGYDSAVIVPQSKDILASAR